MTSFARASLFAVSSLFLACSTAEDPATPADSGHGDTAVAADSASSDTFVADVASGPDSGSADTSSDTMEAAIDSAPVDTGTPVEAGPPPMPVDCFTDDFGPSSFTLVDFFYQVQVGACMASTCSDFVMFDPSCVMTLQVADVEHKATLSPEHCTMFTKWLSSDLLVSHLRDKVTCYGKVDGIYES
ncbi:MAG: hypothetical protein ACXWP4_14575, partial [Polyangiales bacterium]